MLYSVANPEGRPGGHGLLNLWQFLTLLTGISH